MYVSPTSHFRTKTTPSNSHSYRLVGNLTLGLNAQIGLVQVVHYFGPELIQSSDSVGAWLRFYLMLLNFGD